VLWTTVNSLAILLDKRLASQHAAHVRMCISFFDSTEWSDCWLLFIAWTSFPPCNMLYQRPHPGIYGFSLKASHARWPFLLLCPTDNVESLQLDTLQTIRDALSHTIKDRDQWQKTDNMIFRICFISRDNIKHCEHCYQKSIQKKRFLTQTDRL